MVSAVLCVGSATWVDLALQQPGSASCRRFHDLILPHHSSYWDTGGNRRNKHSALARSSDPHTHTNTHTLGVRNFQVEIHAGATGVCINIKRDINTHTQTHPQTNTNTDAHTRTHTDTHTHKHTDKHTGVYEKGRPIVEA